MAEVENSAALFGLQVVDVAPDADMLVWAENWPVFELFYLMRTQWRMGWGGAVGLDYAALPTWCKPGNGGRRGRAMLEALQVMEAEALCVFASQAKKP